jgi:hypothetical protein
MNGTETIGRVFRVPVRNRRLRWLALLYGALVMSWLSREDSDVVGVAVLGCGLSLIVLTLGVTGQFGGRTISARFMLAAGAVLGLLGGLGTAVTTTGLMLFKNALHAHVFLDYPPNILLGILQRAPAWALAGALVSLGLCLAWRASHNMRS